MKQPEANRFYEAEKTSIKLSHSDFSIEENIDFLSEKKDIISFLLSKNWENIIQAKTLHHELKTINYIFEECHMKFKDCIDSIEIFSIITDFYDLDYKTTFDKLLRKNRIILIMDLEKTTNVKLLHFDELLTKSDSNSLHNVLS